MLWPLLISIYSRDLTFLEEGMLHTHCARRMGVYCVMFMLGNAVMNTNDHCFCPVSPQFTRKDIKKKKGII